MEKEFHLRVFPLDTIKRHHSTLHFWHLQLNCGVQLQMPDLILKNGVVSIGCKWSGWKFKSNRKAYLVLDALFEQWDAKTSIEHKEKRGKKGKGKRKRRTQTKLGLKTDSITDFFVLLHPYDVAIPPNSRMAGLCMERYPVCDHPHGNNLTVSWLIKNFFL